MTKAKKLVARMTLLEKATFVSGDGWWQTYSFKRLGIPSIWMSDGPHGLRKAVEADVTTSVPATCFPTASCLASSWDPELIHSVGKALGRECQANGVQLLLGPGNNMKRSPWADGISSTSPKIPSWRAKWPPPISRACKARAWGPP